MASSLMGVATSFATSDTSADDIEFDWFMVTTTAGNVKVYSDNTTNTLLAVPVGVWIPVNHATRIATTGTTAVGFLVV